MPALRALVVSSFVPLAVLLFVCLPARVVEGLCDRSECNCTAARTGGNASTCIFPKRKMLEMSSSDFRQDLSSVEIIRGRELRFGREVFSKLTLLEYVRIAEVSKIFVMEHTFANMTSHRRVRFEFEEGSSLILEGSSWKNLGSSITVAITGFNQVIIQGKAFAWLSELTIKRVNRLELLENAFFIDSVPKPGFTIDSIVLDQVRLDNLAAGAFHSLTTYVRIKGSHIQRVRSDAFNAIQLHHVWIENTTLHVVENGAFSDRTILNTLTLDRVELKELEAGAVLSGTTHLKIHHSKFGILNSGGFNVTVASASINNNIFNRIHSRAFTLKQWDSLSINNNTFKKIDQEAFSSQWLIKKTPPPLINFTRNNLFDIPSNAFDFENNEELKPSIDSNFFHFKCRCDMIKSVKTMIKPFPLSDTLFQTGLCAIDHLLSRCFDLPEGFSSMSNFTDENCSVDEVILCEEVQRDAAIPPLPGITSAVDIEFEEDFEQERRILGTIFIIVLCGMLIMMVLSTFMWIGRNGYCTKARILLLPSTNSFINYLTRLFAGNGMTPTGSAHSISRLSIHEYAELQRKIGEAKEEEEIPLEDKATQTLPEELTQELLQSLQEKLNDPENYSEARNMIEHLYDLIKVEESCNKNYKDSASIHLDDLDKENENLYDVIVPKRKVSTREKKETVSIGTRAPSPDKLLPYSVYGETRKLRPAVSDYMEPKDRQIHTYTELPNRTSPGQTSVICDYGEPNDTRVHLYTELPANVRMANRPLPSKPIDGESMS